MTNFKQAITIQGVTRGTAVVRLSHTDLTAAALTETIDINDLRDAHTGGIAGRIPANARIMFDWFNLIEEFSGVGVLTADADLGDAAAPTELIAAEDVFTGAGLGLKIGAGAFTLGTLEAAYVGQVVMTTTGANVALLDTGEMDIAISYESITTDSLTG